MATLYDILQVTPSASKEVIDMAYKALAKKYHPDLNPAEDRQEAEERMKALNAAYAILKDEQARAEYDSQLNFNNESYNENPSRYHASWEQPQSKEEHQTCQYMTVEPHPWIRYFARFFDMYISTIFIVILWVMLSPSSYSAIFGKVPEYVAGVILYIIWIFIEAILLSTWGTTPGKWLLNAKILDVNGSKLKLGTAAKRGFMVYLYGLWLLIPLVTIGGLITAYNYLKRPNIFTGRSSWDVSCNSSVVVKKASA